MSDAKVAPELINPKDLQYYQPLKLASGFNHVVLLAQDGKMKTHVFSWGDCSGGKIGRIPSSRRRTQNALKIRGLAAKGATNVWACGNHSFYQYKKKASKKDPQAKLELCGWGLNNDGQLGLSHCKEVVSAVDIPFFEGTKVLDVCGGEFHTLVLTDRNIVYSFGLNKDGQLGIGRDIDHSEDPVLVDVPEEVVRISSGAHFNYAITATGQLYSWGQGDNFVLGNQREDSEGHPRLVNPGLFNSDAVVVAAAGGQHALFLTAELQSQQSGKGKRRSESRLEATPKRKKSK